MLFGRQWGASNRAPQPASPLIRQAPQAAATWPAPTSDGAYAAQLAQIYAGMLAPGMGYYPQTAPVAARTPAAQATPPATFQRARYDWLLARPEDRQNSDAMAQWQQARPRHSGFLGYQG